MKEPPDVIRYIRSSGRESDSEGTSPSTAMAPTVGGGGGAPSFSPPAKFRSWGQLLGAAASSSSTGPGVGGNGQQSMGKQRAQYSSLHQGKNQQQQQLQQQQQHPSSSGTSTVPRVARQQQSLPAIHPRHPAGLSSSPSSSSAPSSSSEEEEEDDDEEEDGSEEDDDDDDDEENNSDATCTGSDLALTCNRTAAVPDEQNMRKI